jgi:glycosyltransferase involved in cell wall biosynthesis
MKHLILCPEFPPAPIPPGGIGTYVQHISRLLAEAGEVVHVVAPLWEGATRRVEESCHGRLIVHRVPLDEPLGAHAPGNALSILHGLAQSEFPPQLFAWQAGLFAEALVEHEGIDVIEAQEWQAPLYYFQLRRALGLGPRRRPPCIVFLHSPSEFIIHHNEWDATLPDRLAAKRMEDYCIGAADKLFCPSRFLAAQAEMHYGLAPGSIKVVHLPVGDMVPIKRSKWTWANGSILYVGRLEPRKGIVEWIDAAVAVADAYPLVQFDFVGADLPYANGLSVQQHVNAQIPERLKPRFRFHGSRSRKELLQFLAQARVAVVPSRWENFPNTCVEAMASGLPVIASRNGGMAEMIEDGVNGWITAERGSHGLATALQRALKTPVDAIEAMGGAATQTIRTLCNNDKILQEHLVARAEVARQGTVRSQRLPPNLPWAGQPLKDEPLRRRANGADASGIAVVVSGLDDGQALDGCLSSLERQTRPPAAVALVADARNPGAPDVLARARAQGWIVCEIPDNSNATARNVGVQSVLDTGIGPLAFAFLDSRDRLQPHFIDTCEQVMHSMPEVGVMSSWVRLAGERGEVIASPCPAFPYQLLKDDAVAASAIRTEALEEAGRFREVMVNGYEQHDLINAAMAAGWIGLTFPGLLSERAEVDGRRTSSDLPWHHKMRREMLARLPEIVERDARELVLLLEARPANREHRRTVAAAPYRAPLTAGQVLRMPMREKIALLLEALRRPRAALRFILRQARRLFG